MAAPSGRAKERGQMGHYQRPLVLIGCGFEIEGHGRPRDFADSGRRAAARRGARHGRGYYCAKGGAPMARRTFLLPFPGNPFRHVV